MFKNYMEDLVEEMLPVVLEEYKDICKCEKCTNDMKAIALNNLKPLYFSTEEGNLYLKTKKLNTQFRADVIRQLTKAVQIVSKNPSHD